MDDNYFEEHVVQFLILFGNSMLATHGATDQQALHGVDHHSINNEDKLNVEEYEIFTDDSI